MSSESFRFLDSSTGSFVLILPGCGGGGRKPHSRSTWRWEPCVHAHARSIKLFYQKLIISIVLGTVPSISLLFPSSQPLQSASRESMLGIVPFLS